MTHILSEESPIPKLSDRDEKARRAVKAFRALQPTLTAYARVLTKRNDVQVVMSATQNGATDGKKIFFRPPMALGEYIEHKRSLCDRRGPDKRLLCLACAQREQVLVPIYHEIAHICFDTMVQPTEEDKGNAIAESVRIVDSRYAEPVRAKIERLTRLHKFSYLDLASGVSRWLPLILNALEDARVNNGHFKARSGTKIMFDAETARVFDEGFESVDAAGSPVHKTWMDGEQNMQFIVGLFCKASGYDYRNWFIPPVVEALNDQELTNLCHKVLTLRTARGTFDLVFPVLVRSKELGFCKDPTDPVDDPDEPDEPEPGPVTAPEESSSDPENPDKSDIPDNSGPSDPEDSSDDEMSEGDDGDSSSSSGDDSEDSGDEGDPTSDESGSSEDSGGSKGDGDSDSENSGEDEYPGESNSEEGDSSDEHGAGHSNESGNESDGEEDGEVDGSGTEEESEDGSSGSEGTASDDVPSGEGGGRSQSDEDSSDAYDSSGSSGGEESGPSGDAGQPGASSGGGLDDSSDSDGDLDSGGGDAPDGDGDEPFGGDDRNDFDSFDWDDFQTDYPDDAKDDGEGTSSPDAGGATSSLNSDSLPGDGSSETSLVPDSDAGDLSSSSSEAEETDAATDSGSRSEDSDGAESLDENGEPIDSGADVGRGGTEIVTKEEYDHIPMGDDPEEIKLKLHKWNHHEDPPSSIEEKRAEVADEKSLEKAIIQGLYFETPSSKIHGVREHYHGQPVYVEGRNMSKAWNGDRWGSYSRIAGIGGGDEYKVPESVLGKVLLKMRVAFSDNKRAKSQRHKKEGKIDSRVLGKRAPINDERLFKKKRNPGKRDYFVVIGVDISGSTIGVNIELAKKAAFAQAELCSRVGVKFAVYCHSGDFHNPHGGRYEGIDVDIYHIKDPDEPWDTKVQQRLIEIGPDSCNLDGHTIEYYRKLCDARPETDKIILYFSDGKMPAENHDEELEILQREIKICRQKKYLLLGVGIRTDSPTQHGLETVQVDSIEDLSKVVDQLGSKLMVLR
jgi:hypothetical protein